MLLFHPSVYLISPGPQVDRNEILRFLRDHDHDERFATDHPLPADQVQATGSRLCYDSFTRGRDPDAHLANIVASGHGSVLEHANFTVLCAGVSRALTHELIRHRHLSYSEQSQRYVTVPPRFVVPPLLPDDMVDAWRADQEAAYAKYVGWLQLGGARGLSRKDAHDMARYLLPEGTETRILVTGNIRAWRGFIDQRATGGAAAEIHRLGLTLFATLREESVTWADYEADGRGGLTTPTRKV